MQGSRSIRSGGGSIASSSNSMTEGSPTPTASTSTLSSNCNCNVGSCCHHCCTCSTQGMIPELSNDHFPPGQVNESNNHGQVSLTSSPSSSSPSRGRSHMKLYSSVDTKGEKIREEVSKNGGGKEVRSKDENREGGGERRGAEHESTMRQLSEFQCIMNNQLNDGSTCDSSGLPSVGVGGTIGSTLLQNQMDDDECAISSNIPSHSSTSQPPPSSCALSSFPTTGKSPFLPLKTSIESSVHNSPTHCRSHHNHHHSDHCYHSLRPSSTQHHLLSGKIEDSVSYIIFSFSSFLSYSFFLSSRFPPFIFFFLFFFCSILRPNFCFSWSQKVQYLSSL